ncbi:hypothetical protein [Rhodococcus marinonascens]|uniref:hypothetical protein n=1 Tax=Rhodococcus marinonascens TaxID=38311 RepID=UPI00093251EC|nr:hypothetical protein [Rhodococcus marinonascens]
MKSIIARTMGVAAAATGLTLLSAPTAYADPDDLTVDISGTAGQVVMAAQFDAVGAVICIMWVTPVDAAVPVAVVGPDVVLEGEEVELRARVDPGQYTVRWGCIGGPLGVLSDEQWGTTPPLSSGTVEQTTVTVTEGPGTGSLGSLGSLGNLYGS